MSESRRVGIRELREDLSRTLRRVQRGEAVEVTDRGRPVARLIPLAPESRALAGLIASGKIRPRRGRGVLPPPLDAPSRMTSEEAIDLLRGGR